MTNVDVYTKSRDGIAVHMRSDEYKIGWVHGFYDCVSDDGAFYGVSNQSSCALGHSAGAARLYSLGYQDGMTARLAGDFRRLRYPVGCETDPGASGVGLHKLTPTRQKVRIRSHLPEDSVVTVSRTAHVKS